MSNFNIDTGGTDSIYQPGPHDPASGTHGIAETDDVIITDLEATQAGINDLANRVGTKSWSASLAVKLRQRAQGSNGALLECTTAGTTGSSEPTWPSTPGSSVTDGSVTWRLLSPGSGAYVGQVAAPTGVAATDVANIQAALNAARAAGGGTVQLQAGTYNLTLGPHPNSTFSASYNCCLAIGQGVWLRGAGRDATTLLLVAGQSTGYSGTNTSIIYNWNLNGPDYAVKVSDLTVNGNAANQPSGTSFICEGITFVRTVHALCDNVAVKNVRGYGSGPPGETFHFETQLGLNTRYINCLAYSDDGGEVASGFSADGATIVKYVQCSAYGMTDGMGFTHYNCSRVTYTDCDAWGNGDHGFNSEWSYDLTYEQCQAGFIMGGPNGVSSPQPYTSGSFHGNTGSGFVSNGATRASYVACTAMKNGGAGLTVSQTAGYATPSGVRIRGGNYINNTGAGITVVSGAAAGVIIEDRPTISGNTPDLYSGQASTNVTNANFSHVNSVWTLPASNTSATNPFSTTMDIYFTAAPSSVTDVQLNSQSIVGTGSVPTHMKWEPGVSLKLVYTALPTYVLQLCDVQ